MYELHKQVSGFLVRPHGFALAWYIMYLLGQGSEIFPVRYYYSTALSDVLTISHYTGMPRLLHAAKGIAS